MLALLHYNKLNQKTIISQNFIRVILIRIYNPDFLLSYVQ